MPVQKKQRYSDEVLEDLKDYLDLKFEMINTSMTDLKCEVKRHDVLLVGINGDTGLVKENNDLKNSITTVKWIGILLSALLSITLSIKSFFKN